MIRVCLVGNPNSGKTTLFNNLTGASAHVGNWPGVTVEKLEGKYRGKKGSEPIIVTDLPGIYSFSPYSNEEIVSRNFIIDDHPDVIINIVDATSLERNLYLTTQLLETNIPVVVALNLMDVVNKTATKIDVEALSLKLGVPVVSISALKNTGLQELMTAVVKVASGQRTQKTIIKNKNLIKLIKKIEKVFAESNFSNPLFHAIKMIEGDEYEAKNHPDILGAIKEAIENFSDPVFGADLEALIANERYEVIEHDFMLAAKIDENTNARTVKIDKVFTHKIWGIPIFLVILFLIFHLTFSEDLFYLNAMGLVDVVSFANTPFEGLFATAGINSPGVILFNILDIGSSSLSAWIGDLLATSPQWVNGLIVDGVLGGLLAILGFLPQILLLFFFFSLLEDTGYMARIAFILDRIFRRLGISGRAIMPLIMGFGCSVPAMIATKPLKDENERISIIRVIPFFSCGAKLPILTGIAGGIVQVFGIANVDLITYGMYLLGILTALTTIIIMRNTSLKGTVTPFIMELPAYRLPRFQSLMIHLWDKLKHFLKKAFTIILASTIVIWFICHFSFRFEFLTDERMNESIISLISQVISPIFTPLGFGWQLHREFGWVFTVTIISGLIAKENVVAVLVTLASVVASGFAGGEAEAINSLIASSGIMVPALLSFVAFNMLTIPCFAAVATARAELPKKKFFTTILFWLATSYLVSSIIYVSFSWWWSIFIFIALGVGVYFLIHYVNIHKRKKLNAAH
ncbi:MAG: ferrous iron transport protein B [Acholeplasmatales bacterium]|nr:ferrous iron transport protein B [Acholeplasmatales bacterium]